LKAGIICADSSNSDDGGGTCVGHGFSCRLQGGAMTESRLPEAALVVAVVCM
jgi:hypothetical protein